MKETRRRYLRTELCLVFMLANGCHNGASDSPVRVSESAADLGVPIEEIVSAPVTIDELDLAFARDYPPDIEYALNEVKRSRLSFDVTKMIACAYTNCPARNSGWHNVVYDSDLVRVNMLDVLAQARSQGIDHAVDIDFRSDAVRFLDSDNPFVARRAMLIIAHMGEPQDAEILEREAIYALDDTTFRVAIIALKVMSTEESEASIRRVVEAVDIDRRAIVSELGQ